MYCTLLLLLQLLFVNIYFRHNNVEKKFFKVKMPFPLKQFKNAFC